MTHGNTGRKFTKEHRANLSAAKKRAPIYVLPHGIKVIGESFRGTYVLCRVEEHRLFPNSKPDKSGRISVQRARVVMTAKLGRVLKFSEHVHHKNEKKKHDDRLSNLELLTAAEHNKHHKTGTRHSPESRAKTSATIRAMHERGEIKVVRLRGKKNGFFGKKHSSESLAKMRGPRGPRRKK